VYGELGRVLNRWAGLAIVVFVTLHLVGQGVMYVGTLRPLARMAGGLASIQHQPWVRAVLFASLTFHFLYGLKLVALDLGARIDYRVSFWLLVSLATLMAARELLRYAGV